MAKCAIVLGMMLLLTACGGKKAPETPPPVAQPSGVEKGAAPPPVVSAERPTEAKAEPEVKKPEPEPEVKKPEPEPEPEVKKPEPEPEPEVKEVEAAPEPEPKVAEEPGGGGATAIAPDLQVTDSALTSEVVDRMPSDRKTTWKVGEDTRLIGWFELKNPGSKVDLELVWKKDGKENWRFPTSAGSGKNWRTWAEKRIGKRDAGQWTVELVDANGFVYGSLNYTVE